MNKKSMHIRVLACILMMAVMTMITATAATQPEGDSIQASDYIMTYSAWTSAGSNGKVHIYYDIDATKNVARIGAKLIVVQMLDAGTWTPVQTTTGTVANGMLLQNDSSHMGSLVYQGNVGNTYRAVVTVYAGPVSGGDSRVVTTNSVVAKSS